MEHLIRSMGWLGGSPIKQTKCLIYYALLKQYRGVPIEKKNTLKEEVYYMVVYHRAPPFILFLTSPPCTVSAATTSNS